MSSNNEGIDMHDIRMRIGANTMAMSDAIDEDVVRLAVKAAKPAMKAYRRLINNDVTHTQARDIMIGMLLGAIDSERE